jgi:hypothetical protein
MKKTETTARVEETGRLQGCGSGLVNAGLNDRERPPGRRPMGLPRFRIVRSPFYFLLEAQLRRSVARLQFHPG